MSDLAIPTPSPQALVLPRSAAGRDAWIASSLLLALVVLPHFILRDDPDNQFGRIDVKLFVHLGLCAACGLYGLMHFSRVCGLLNRFPLAWMVLAGVVAVATIPFSADPRRAMASSTVLWSVLLFVPAALLQLGLRRALKIILAGSVVYMIGQWIMYFLVPEIGHGADVLPDGSFAFRLGSDPQQLGFQSVVTVGLAMILLHEGQLSRRRHWVLLGLAAATMAGCGSRTAAVAAMVGAGIILLWRLSPAQGLCSSSPAAWGFAWCISCCPWESPASGSKRLKPVLPAAVRATRSRALQGEPRCGSLRGEDRGISACRLGLLLHACRQREIRFSPATRA